MLNSVRTLMLATTLLAVVGITTYRVWTKPYARFGTWPDGRRAWEEWERRDLLFELEYTRSLRWYPNGQIANDYDKRNHVELSWDPDGNSINGDQWMDLLTMEMPAESTDSYRPFEYFLDCVDWLKF